MKNKPVKLTVTFLCVCAVIFGSLSLAAYCFDPQNVYRWNEKGKRYFNPTYSAAGAVEHYDYDAVFIGSSLFQNLDAEHLAKLFDCKPIKLTIGAMIPEEMLYLYSCTQDTNKAKTFVLNVDLHRLAASVSVRPDCGRFPDFMFNAGGISQFKYLLGYETWFRFMPIDLAMSAAELFEISLPASVESMFDNATDINEMCEWENENPPGRDKVIADYLEGYKGFNEGDKITYVDNPLKNVEDLLDCILAKLDPDETVTIVLPPCSSLYWADKNPEQLDALLAMRQRFAEITDGYSNIRLIDLQAIEQTTNLDLYYDNVHFCKEVQTFVENALVTDDYLADTAKVNANSKTVRQNAQQLLQELS